LTILGQATNTPVVDVSKSDTVVVNTVVTNDAPNPWVDIFGLYEPDPPVPEASGPEVTIVNHSYLLKGLFASSDSSWAIVADGGGEYLLRKGDELPGGALVSDINEEGVWLDTAQGRELIAFDE
jgi:hypothetical protein